MANGDNANTLTLMRQENVATVKRLKEQQEAIPLPGKECLSKETHIANGVMFRALSCGSEQTFRNQELIMGIVSKNGNGGTVSGKFGLFSFQDMTATNFLKIVLGLSILFFLIESRGCLPKPVQKMFNSTAAVVVEE